MLEELTGIGFTEYEAKVYVALLRNHPATGYQISKESGVPRSMVYEALKRLHGRGAALETVENRSTLYKPLPPGALLDRHQAEHGRLVDSLRKGLEEQYTQSIDDRAWTIHGRSTAISFAAQLIDQAVDELFLVLTDDDLEALNEPISRAASRGVDVNTLLTGEGELDCGRVAYHPPLESEVQGLAGTLLVEADEAEVLIASAAPGRETSATVTRNLDLVLIARQFVWMELFTQRIYAKLGGDLLERLDPEDRTIFESLATAKRGRGT